MPFQNLAAPSCVEPIYVDALYVPEHPHSKKQELILLTQEAKDSIVAEANRCKQAINIDDHDSMLKALAELGVLDSFSRLGHERFLRIKDPNLANAYRYALLQRKQFSINSLKKVLFFPADDARLYSQSIRTRLNIIQEKFEGKVSAEEAKKDAEFRRVQSGGEVTEK